MAGGDIRGVARPCALILTFLQFTLDEPLYVPSLEVYAGAMMLLLLFWGIMDLVRTRRPIVSGVTRKTPAASRSVSPQKAHAPRLTA